MTQFLEFLGKFTSFNLIIQNLQPSDSIIAEILIYLDAVKKRQFFQRQSHWIKSCMLDKCDGLAAETGVSSALSTHQVSR